MATLTQAQTYMDAANAGTKALMAIFTPYTQQATVRGTQRVYAYPQDARLKAADLAGKLWDKPDSPNRQPRPAGYRAARDFLADYLTDATVGELAQEAVAALDEAMRLAATKPAPKPSGKPTAKPAAGDGKAAPDAALEFDDLTLTSSAGQTAKKIVGWSLLGMGVLGLGWWGWHKLFGAKGKKH